jgi:hypothetical protein
VKKREREARERLRPYLGDMVNTFEWDVIKRLNRDLSWLEKLGEPTPAEFVEHVLESVES